MTIEQVWADFVGSLPRDWPSAMAMIELALANPWARAAGLLLIVWLTIMVIAAIYSGEKSGAELGPVAVRPHVSGRYNRTTVRVPHNLIAMNMDGVIATCKIIYAYTDARGKRRRQVVHTITDATLSISPVTIPRVQSIIFGQEVPSVEREYVCFPLELEEPLTTVTPALSDAAEYAAAHNILERWREDDDAVVVSTHGDVLEQIADGKIEFIGDEVERLKSARQNWFARKLKFPGLYKKRPNVVGSYYLKFEYSRNPLFILTRHPDRELKMTAWLTVLTSVFALIMDAWPKAPATPSDATIVATERVSPEVRTTVRAPVITPP